MGDADLLDLVAENVLHELAEGLEACLLLFLCLLLILSIAEVEALLGARDELLAVVLLELLDHVLIDGVDEVQYLVASLFEAFEEGRGGNGCLRLASDVVDALLALLHASDVLLKRDQFVAGLGGVEAEEISNLVTVGGVLVDTKFEVLGELFVELLVVVLLLFGPIILLVVPSGGSGLSKSAHLLAGLRGLLR